MRREKIAGLDAVVTGGEGPTVVLLHGFGAPGEDLMPLERVLQVPTETRFIFPGGAHSLDGGWDGRAWWMIDVMAMQQAIRTGRARDLAAQVPDGLPEARAQLSAFLDEVAARFSPPKLVLGGFSQGAMLSMDVTLHREEKPDGLVLLGDAARRKRVGAAHVGEPGGAGVSISRHAGSDAALCRRRAASRSSQRRRARRGLGAVPRPA